MSDIDPQTLRDVVRAAVNEVLAEAEAGARPSRRGPPTRALSEPAHLAAGRRPLPAPLSATAIDRIRRATPARVATGRTGTRYLTDDYLGLRADHAIALDAVRSEIPDGFPEAQGWVPLRSRCKDHGEFLLHPDLGRRLDDASAARVASEVDHDADVQIIAGDGLSAFALVQNGPPLVSALLQRLPEVGLSVGTPLFVRLARVGVQDDIGVRTKAKATVIIVGERPGLGTGDSLSIYTAFAPKLGQDNAEKDCLSNIRNLGVLPEEAARQCADLLRRTFAAGGGGVHLVRSDGQSGGGARSGR